MRSIWKENTNIYNCISSRPNTTSRNKTNSTIMNKSYQTKCLQQRRIKKPAIVSAKSLQTADDTFISDWCPYKQRAQTGNKASVLSDIHVGFFFICKIDIQKIKTGLKLPHPFKKYIKIHIRNWEENYIHVLQNTTSKLISYRKKRQINNS